MGIFVLKCILRNNLVLINIKTPMFQSVMFPKIPANDNVKALYKNIF